MSAEERNQQVSKKSLKWVIRILLASIVVLGLFGFIYVIKQYQQLNKLIDTVGSTEKYQQNVEDLQKQIDKTTQETSANIDWDSIVKPQGANDFTISKASMKEIKPEDLLSMARVVPSITEDSQVTGLKVLGIKPNSMVAALGIKNFDIIEAVNSTELDDPTKVMSLIAELQGAKEFKLKIKREEKSFDLNIKIID